jgi:hypothetical protein
MKKKISHEVPISLLGDSLKFNEESIHTGREVLLDNSLFELGEAFNADEFANWIDLLKPTYYIVPDAMNDFERTMSNAKAWMRKFGKLPGKKIGVLQGSNLWQFIQAYRTYQNLGFDKVAISFGYEFYENSIHHPNKNMQFMIGRFLLINEMIEERVIDSDFPVHLLGCGLPQEFVFYNDERYNFIESIDTSSPVVNAIFDQQYRHYGVQDKPSMKLADLIDYPKEKIDMEILDWNLTKFKHFVNGWTSNSR